MGKVKVGVYFYLTSRVLTKIKLLANYIRLCCSYFHSFLLELELPDIQDRHRLSHEFGIWPYCRLTFCLRVTYPLEFKKPIFDLGSGIVPLFFFI